MRDLSQIVSCLDVTDQDIHDALAPATSFGDRSPRERTLALVERMASVAQPEQGAAKLLLVAAHLATHEWLEGDLTVKLIGDDELSVLELLVDDGLSLERIAGPLRIDVPMQEFEVAVSLHPEMLAPLALRGKLDSRRIFLKAKRRERRNSRPPKVTAFASALMPAVGGRSYVTPSISQPKPKPPPPRRPAPAREARRAPSMPSFDKASATLIFDDTSADDAPEIDELSGASLLDDE